MSEQNRNYTPKENKADKRKFVIYDRKHLLEFLSSPFQQLGITGYCYPVVFVDEKELKKESFDHTGYMYLTNFMYLDEKKLFDQLPEFSDLKFCEKATYSNAFKYVAIEDSKEYFALAMLHLTRGGRLKNIFTERLDNNQYFELCKKAVELNFGNLELISIGKQELTEEQYMQLLDIKSQPEKKSLRLVKLNDLSEANRKKVIEGFHKCFDSIMSNSFYKLFDFETIEKLLIEYIKDGNVIGISDHKNLVDHFKIEDKDFYNKLMTSYSPYRQ